MMAVDTAGIPRHIVPNHGLNPMVGQNFISSSCLLDVGGVDPLRDIAWNCQLLSVDSEFYDAGPLSDCTYQTFAEKLEAARREFRSVLARLILDNKGRIKTDRARYMGWDREDTSPTEPLIDHDLIQLIVNDIYTDSPATTAGPTYPHPESIETAPWLHKPSQPIPKTAQYIALADMDCHVDNFDSRLYFRRTRKKDELWVDPDLGGTGCVVSCLKHGEPLEGALRVLGIHLASIGGFTFARSITEAGTRLAGHGDAMRQALSDALHTNRNSVKENGTDSEIVAAARKLGLHPEPTGNGPSQWQAQCPGRGHQLDIGAKSESFGCGYCKVKGGVGELEGLVSARRNDLQSR